MVVYANPGTHGAKVTFKARYEHYIGGEWRAPVAGRYFENPTPITGVVFTEVGRGSAEDIEAALDAAQIAEPSWAKTSPAERALILNRIADLMEQNLEMLAVAETWDNGKAIRETLGADIPLAIDLFRYFAGVIRTWESSQSQIDEDTVAFQFHEPLGVVGQIIPWNFPILMAVWKVAPALAAGNVVVLKPAEQTPASILVLAELVGGILPPGVLNIVNGLEAEAGLPLASDKRIQKIGFTREPASDRLFMEHASQRITPVVPGPGGESSSIFFDDVMAGDDAYWDKVQEGFTRFALNQGEACTCPSRALVQNSVADRFLDAVVERIKAIRYGNPLDTNTMMGAQTSNEQLGKFLSYLDIGRQEGAEILIGGVRAELDGDLAGGYYVQPAICRGTKTKQIFREDIIGPVVSVVTFDSFDDSIAIVNDCPQGLGAGVWTRDTNTAYRAGRAIRAGRVRINDYHAYPAHAAFDGYESSSIGRENSLLMLTHYQQTKNLVVSYSEGGQDFF